MSRIVREFLTFLSYKLRFYLIVPFNISTPEIRAGGKLTDNEELIITHMCHARSSYKTY